MSLYFEGIFSDSVAQSPVAIAEPVPMTKIARIRIPIVLALIFIFVSPCFQIYCVNHWTACLRRTFVTSYALIVLYYFLIGYFYIHWASLITFFTADALSLIHISEPTRRT